MKRLKRYAFSAAWVGLLLACGPGETGADGGQHAGDLATTQCRRAVALPSTSLLTTLGSAAPPRMYWDGQRYAVTWSDVRSPDNIATVFFAFADAGAHLDPASIQPISVGNEDHESLVAFSGAEYGVAYASGEMFTSLRFVRVSTTQQVLPGSDWKIGDLAGAGFGLAWNPVSAEWGVAWTTYPPPGTAGGEVLFARIAASDPTVATTPIVISEAAGGMLSRGGRSPLAWTEAGYALVYLPSGSNYVQLAELSPTGTVQRRIQVGSGRQAPVGAAALAWDGGGYGVAWSDLGAAHFGRVDRAGSYVIASEQQLDGSNPDLVWNGQEYLIGWDRAALVASDMSTLWGMRVSGAGDVLQSATQIAPTYRFLPSLSWDGCQYALVYRAGTPRLESDVTLFHGALPAL